MKNYFTAIAIAICFLSIGGCSNSNPSDKGKQSTQQVAVSAETIQILYFHGDRRCPTCLGVGDLSEKLYQRKYKGNSLVSYSDINIDRDENQAVAKKYQVSGSSLIIDVKGKPNDITFEAFKFALTEPDSLINLITDVVESGLKR
jgi:hypothetical protein